MRVCLCSIVLLFGLKSGVAQEPQWLGEWLSDNKITVESVKTLAAEPDATRGLSRQEAEAATKTLWTARRKTLREERAAEVEAREITIGKKKMPFWYKVFGEKPEGGRSLFISMHGGGGAPARVNNQQYENQKRLYQPKEGVYLVPRAPTDTWNLWHQGHIDTFFDRIITNMIVFEDVNPNRVYIMGYSAGGDGVYQLAPRMADRLAAAAMMAGHPNETAPDGLRNIGFTLHMGGDDGAYKRNQIAAQWKEKLKKLRDGDPEGYKHEVVIHEGLGHWMQRKDAVAVPWMAKFTRKPFPQKVVWKQDDVAHSRFYWLGVKNKDRRNRSRVVASVKDNEVTIEESGLDKLQLMLSDALLDLDKPVTVTFDGQEAWKGTVKRTVADIARSLVLRDDPAAVVSAVVDVAMKATEAE